MPFAIHPTFEPQWTKGSRMGAWENVRELRLTASVQASDGVRHQFSTLFDYGVFDKFPQLKILVLESGGGWIGYWLDRMDGVFGHTAIGQRVPLDQINYRIPSGLTGSALNAALQKRILCYSSDHTGGANILFSDGSVHFLADGLNLLTLQSLATRSGGEVIQNY